MPDAALTPYPAYKVLQIQYIGLIRSATGNFAFGISLKPAPERAGFGFLS